MIKLNLSLGLLSLFISIFAYAKANTYRLINGTEVTDGSYKHVVWISRKNQAGEYKPVCTGTVVGPRVIVTAAHCGGEGATIRFSINGTQYDAVVTRSPLYTTGKNHDMALGLTSKDITGVEPATIGGTAQSGMELLLMGYGCTTPVGGGQATGGMDGKLRKGTSVVTQLAGYDVITQKAGAAATCIGDSGGPAFAGNGSNEKLLGIISRGNLKDKSYNIRLDIQESKTFLNDYVSQKGVEICGVNKDCNGTVKPAPTCQLSASPSSIQLGQSVTLSLTAFGEANAASINGSSVAVPNGQIVLTPSSKGTFNASGTVSGPGGSNSCATTYTVTDTNTPPAPTCNLVANPSSIKLGQSLTLQVNVFGNATSATINGASVNVPNGQLTLTPPSAGTFNASSTVTGPGGSNSCTTTYFVDGSINPDPPSCTLTATPNQIELGQSVVINLQSQGDVTRALIDGKVVSFPSGQITVTPTQVGQQQSHGVVEGPGGQGNCRVTYSVDDATVQPIPELTVVSSYCGLNTDGHPDVREVCLAVLKNISATRSQYIKEAVVVTYTNSTKEVLPVIHRKRGSQVGSQLREELTVYANLAVREGQFLLLDSRKVVVTKKVTSGLEGAIPISLEGRSANGKYFIVDQLGSP